jgi:hypothetical protein
MYTPAFTGLVSITGNTFKNRMWVSNGVPNDGGADISGMNIHVNSNRFFNNNFGIAMEQWNADAQNNWWGCNYGPGMADSCSATPNGIGLNGCGSQCRSRMVLGTSAHQIQRRPAAARSSRRI